MTTAGPVSSFGAILLAGGRATRVDGAVKPLFDVGGRTLLRRAVDAARAADADPVVISGPVLDESIDVHWVADEPPFGGPVAGIAAALGRSALWVREPDWTFVLACDLPRVEAAVERLRADILLLPADTDGMCLADASSRPQWLTGVYRTRVLRAAAESLPEAGRDAAVRELLHDLAIVVVAAPDDLTADVDTWEDLERAREAAAHPSPASDPQEDS